MRRAWTPPSPAQSTNASQRASGSSFYTAMRILPRAQREAMFEIYSFCRRVDDIADSTAPRPQRLAELAAWRAEIDALYAGQVGPQSHAGWHGRCASSISSREDFLAVIDGMEMDALDDIRAPNFATLDLYCDRVASAVGRLSVRVFGLERERRHALAHHLGRALQLTNILRDLDEDAAIGRLYLPREALQQAGITTTDPATALRSPDAGRRPAPRSSTRAREHFAEADTIMARAPRRAVRAPRIMGEVYRSILDRLVARGFGAAARAGPRLRARASLWIVLRYALI